MSVLGGVNTGINLFNSVENQKQRQVNNAALEVRQQREGDESDSRINLQRIQAQSYQRAMQREDTKAASQAELYRLAREQVFFENLDHDLGDDGKIDTDVYLGIWNAQDKDLIDPHGDGRQISRIDQMPNGKWALGISGPGVDGTQPMTKNRGTAADGDNEVVQFSPDELIHDHLGRRQALAEKYPQLAEMLNGDPKQLSKWIKQQVLGVKMKMAEQGAGSSAAERAARMSADNQATEHGYRMDEQAHASALRTAEDAAKAKTGGSGSRARELQVYDAIAGQNPNLPDDEIWKRTRDVMGRSSGGFAEQYVSKALQEQTKAGLVEGDDGYKTVDDLVKEARTIKQSLDAPVSDAGGGGDDKPKYDNAEAVRAAYRAGDFGDPKSPEARAQAKKLIQELGGIGGGAR